MKVAVLTILQNMINGAIDIINNFIGLLNKIPGVSIEAIGHVTFATTAAAENDAAKKARAAELSAYESDLAAAKAERDAHINSLKSELNSSVSGLSAAYDKAKSEAQTESNAAQTAFDSFNLEQSALENISAGTGETAVNTAQMADALETSEEELKLIREIAERQAINKFTTAEVKLDFTGMTNKIDSDVDLDGFISQFTVKMEDALYTVAEGVHV